MRSEVSHWMIGSRTVSLFRYRLFQLIKGSYSLVQVGMKARCTVVRLWFLCQPEGLTEVDKLLMHSLQEGLRTSELHKDR